MEKVLVRSLLFLLLEGVVRPFPFRWGLGLELLENTALTLVIHAPAGCTLLALVAVLRAVLFWVFGVHATIAFLVAVPGHELLLNVDAALPRAGIDVFIDTFIAVLAFIAVVWAVAVAFFVVNAVWALLSAVVVTTGLGATFIAFLSLDEGLDEVVHTVALVSPDVEGHGDGSTVTDVDMDTAEVSFLLAPAFSTSFTLLAVQLAVLRLVLVLDAASAVTIAPVVVVLLVDRLSHSALLGARVLLLLPALPAPFALPAVSLALCITELSIWTVRAVFVAVTATTGFEALVLEPLSVDRFVDVCVPEFFCLQVHMVEVRFIVWFFLPDNTEVRVLLAVWGFLFAPALAALFALVALDRAVATLFAFKTIITFLIAPLLHRFASDWIESTALIRTRVHLFVDTLIAVSALVTIIRAAAYTVFAIAFLAIFLAPASSTGIPALISFLCGSSLEHVSVDFIHAIIGARSASCIL